MEIYIVVMRCGLDDLPVFPTTSPSEAHALGKELVVWFNRVGEANEQDDKAHADKGLPEDEYHLVTHIPEPPHLRTAKKTLSLDTSVYMGVDVFVYRNGFLIHTQKVLDVKELYAEVTNPLPPRKDKKKRGPNIK